MSNISALSTDQLQSSVADEELLSRQQLSDFLDDMALGESKLNYEQMQGFMLAVACCPQQLDAEDWLPVVLGEAYTGDQLMLGPVSHTLEVLLVNLREQLIDETFRLPETCLFSWDPWERRQLEHWCEGFLLGDEWLETHWMQALALLKRDDPVASQTVADELDEVVGLVKVLADVDGALELLEQNPEDPVEDLREQVRDSFNLVPDYLQKYAHVGRGLAWYMTKHEPTVREEPKVGRNEPCPCGSGKKYKKCCMNQS